MPTLLSKNFSIVQDRNGKETALTNSDNKNDITTVSISPDTENRTTYQSPTSSAPPSVESQVRNHVHPIITVPPASQQRPSKKTIPSASSPKSSPDASPQKQLLKQLSSSFLISPPAFAPLTLPTIADNPGDALTLAMPPPTISIWTAAEQGDLDALTYYIRHSTQPFFLLNKRDPKTECTLLHLAITHVPEPYAVLKLLLTHGADPCAHNVYNVQALHTIPLHVARPRECMRLLLDHDAQVNCRDGDGWTPLHYAARFCHPPLPVLELLVQHGAEIGAVDASRKTPLFGLLANGDHVDAFAYLIQRFQEQRQHTNGHITQSPVSSPKSSPLPSSSVSPLASSLLQCRGDFLDTATRRTHAGSIVLQAAKYLRVECLQWLMVSSNAMDHIKPILTYQELTYAIRLAQQQQQNAHAGSLVVNNSRKMILLLQTLLATVQDPATITPPPSPILNTLQKRLSMIYTRRRDHQQYDADYTSEKVGQDHDSKDQLQSNEPDPVQEQEDEEVVVSGDRKSYNPIKRMISLLAKYKKPIVIQEQPV